jgi:hypothetical protein
MSCVHRSLQCSNLLGRMKVCSDWLCHAEKHAQAAVFAPRSAALQHVVWN